MTGIEHLVYRQSANSGFSNVSRIADGATARSTRGVGDEALRYERVTSHQGSFDLEHTFRHLIGTNQAGQTTHSLRVWVRDGTIEC